MTSHPLFTTYLKELPAVTQQGDAREESFYSTLQEMMETVAKATGRAHMRVTPCLILADGFAAREGKGHSARLPLALLALFRGQGTTDSA